MQEVTAVPLLHVLPRAILSLFAPNVVQFDQHSLPNTSASCLLSLNALSLTLPKHKNFTVDLKAWQLCRGTQKERKEDEEFNFGRGLATI